MEEQTALKQVGVYRKHTAKGVATWYFKARAEEDAGCYMLKVEDGTGTATLWVTPVRGEVVRSTRPIHEKLPAAGAARGRQAGGKGAARGGQGGGAADQEAGSGQSAAGSAGRCLRGQGGWRRQLLLYGGGPGLGPATRGAGDAASASQSGGGGAHIGTAKTLPGPSSKTSRPTCSTCLKMANGLEAWKLTQQRRRTRSRFTSSRRPWTCRRWSTTPRPRRSWPCGTPTSRGTSTGSARLRATTKLRGKGGGPKASSRAPSKRPRGGEGKATLIDMWAAKARKLREFAQAGPDDGGGRSEAGEDKGFAAEVATEATQDCDMAEVDDSSPIPQWALAKPAGRGGARRVAVL